jgi:hypothetical protein
MARTGKGAKASDRSRLPALSFDKPQQCGRKDHWNDKAENESHELGLCHDDGSKDRSFTGSIRPDVAAIKDDSGQSQTPENPKGLSPAHL